MSDLNRIDLFDRVDNFPKAGITFYDVRGFLRRPQLWAQAIEEVADAISELDVDTILAPDARSFLFAAPLCVQEGIRLVICRKPGRLPAPVLTQSYDTEYSKDALEMGEYDIKPEDRVLLFDDVIATGGTMVAMRELCRQAGNVPVAAATMLELTAYNIRETLALPVWSWAQV